MAKGTPTKQCRKCGIEKPTTEFYAAKSNRDGLASWCKSCAIENAAANKRRYRAEGRYAEKERAYRSARYKRLWKTDPEFKAREYERKRRWAKLNPERARAYFLNRKNKRLYGLTTDQVLALIQSQNNRCAACGREFSISVQGNGPLCPNVDHNHRTGRVRGILCGDCNLAAGKLGDWWARAQVLADYLRRHSEEEMV